MIDSNYSIGTDKSRKACFMLPVMVAKQRSLLLRFNGDKLVDEEDFYRPVEDSWFTRLLLTIGGYTNAVFMVSPRSFGLSRYVKWYLFLAVCYDVGKVVTGRIPGRDNEKVSVDSNHIPGGGSDRDAGIRLEVF